LPNEFAEGAKVGRLSSAERRIGVTVTTRHLLIAKAVDFVLHITPCADASPIG
jgi:hypothetical protein